MHSRAECMASLDTDSKGASSLEPLEERETKFRGKVCTNTPGQQQQHMQV